MSLEKFLKDNGFDLIDGLVRDHAVLQLWRKTTLDKIEPYYGNVNHAFKSDIPIEIIESPALNVTSEDKDEYSFNIGISILQRILKSLGLGTLDLSLKITSGKKVSISYNSSVLNEVPVGTISDYFSTADFLHPNDNLLDNANRDNIIIISGVLSAKDLLVEIETNFEIDSSIVVELNEIAEGKFNFNKEGTSILKMEAASNHYFPVAVRAHRLVFSKGHFKNARFVTDNHDWF